MTRWDQNDASSAAGSSRSPKNVEKIGVDFDALRVEVNELENAKRLMKVELSTPDLPNSISFHWAGQQNTDGELARSLAAITDELTKSDWRIHPNVLERTVNGIQFTYRLLYGSENQLYHLMTTRTASSVTSLTLTIYSDESNLAPDRALLQRAVMAAHDEVAIDFGVWRTDIKYESSRSGEYKVSLPLERNYERGR